MEQIFATKATHYAKMGFAGKVTEYLLIRRGRRGRPLQYERPAITWKTMMKTDTTKQENVR